MNEKELAEIEERADAATPGPWDIGHEAPPLYAGNSCITAKIGERAKIIFEANHNFELDNSAAFIAHARQDIPALVAEVRRLASDLAYEKEYVGVMEGEKQALLQAHVERKAENDRLRAALEEIKDYTGPESDIEDGWSHIYHLASEALKGGAE